MNYIIIVISAEASHRGSFLARTLVSNLMPFLATYSASLSMTGWMSGGGGMMTEGGGPVTGTDAGAGLELLTTRATQKLFFFITEIEHIEVKMHFCVLTVNLNPITRRTE